MIKMIELTERTPATTALDQRVGQHGTYDQERQQHLQAFMARMPGEMDRLTAPLQDLHAARDTRLRALIRVAKERSPWHARRLRHVDPDTIRGDDLSMIPPMTKTDLMNHWDEIVTDRRLTLDLVNQHLAHVAAHGPAYLLDQYHVVASGGSTGRRGAFVWDFEGWLQGQLVLTRHMGWLASKLGPPRLQRIASVLAANETHMSRAMMRTFEGEPGSIFHLSVTLPLPQIVAELNTYQPDALYSYPSMLHRLALEARAGRLHIAATFAAPLLNIYACSEGGLLAWSYPNATSLHLVEDIGVYEPVDAQSRPIPAGAPAAKLLLTNVINQVLPLIRYELTDEFSLLAEPNPDPWTGRRISEVQGRLDEYFHYSGPIEVHPHLFRSALARVPEVMEYQVRQTARGANIVVEADGVPDLAPARDAIRTGLARLGLANPEVTVVAVARLNRHPGTGKISHFIPQQA